MKKRKTYTIKEMTYHKEEIVTYFHYGTFIELCESLSQYGKLDHFGNVKSVCEILNKSVKGVRFDYSTL